MADPLQDGTGGRSLTIVDILRQLEPIIPMTGFGEVQVSFLRISIFRIANYQRKQSDYFHKSKVFIEFRKKRKNDEFG